MSSTIDDLKPLHEVMQDCMLALCNTIRLVLPERLVVHELKGGQIPTTPYVSLMEMEAKGFNSSDYGNDPMLRKYDELTQELIEVFQYEMPISVRVYKENAIADAVKIRQFLKNKETLNVFFAENGRTDIGVKAMSQPRQTPVVIDEQQVEPSATMIVTVSFYCTERTPDAPDISQVYLNGCKVLDGTGETTLEFDLSEDFEN